MRNFLSTLIIPTTLILSSASFAHDTNNSSEAHYRNGHSHGGQRNHGNPVNGHIDSRDWYESCSNASRELTRARRDASFHAVHGRLAEAASELKSAVYRVADGDLRIIGRQAPGPHLAFAALEGQKILQTADGALGALPARLRVQVDYLISSELVDLLIQAFDDLDNKYVKQISDDCGSCWFDKLPLEYFDGVRLLALRFVELQIKLQEVLASDLVEIKIAKSVTIAATNFLEAYTGRRAYCSALNDLIDLKDWICGYMQQPNYPSYELIPAIRHRLKHIKNELNVSKRGC